MHERTYAPSRFEYRKRFNVVADDILKYFYIYSSEKIVSEKYKLKSSAAVVSGASKMKYVFLKRRGFASQYFRTLFLQVSRLSGSMGIFGPDYLYK